MTNYPGDEGRDEGRGDQQPDEPTQPLGWQQPETPRGWDAPGPTSSYEQPRGQQPSPYGQPPAYGAPPPYAASPYAQQPHGIPLARPDHPQATLALILGLVGLAGGIATCGLLLVVSPFAWVIGRRAVRDIEASDGQYGGEGSARAGFITGIIGTIFLALAIVVLVVYVVILVGVLSSVGTDYSNV